MCVYLSDPDCSGKTGMRQLIVVKAVKDGQWLQAKVPLRGYSTKKNIIFCKTTLSNSFFTTLKDFAL